MLLVLLERCNVIIVMFLSWCVVDIGVFRRCWLLIEFGFVGEFEYLCVIVKEVLNNGVWWGYIVCCGCYCVKRSLFCCLGVFYVKKVCFWCWEVVVCFFLMCVGVWWWFFILVVYEVGRLLGVVVFWGYRWFMSRWYEYKLLSV